MKRIILSLVLVCIFAMPAHSQIGQAHRINVRGSEYVVTDIKAHAHKWKLVGPKSLTLNTVVIKKEGDQVQGYPITVKCSELTKDDLKAIPDFRPLEERHPFRAFVLKQGPNIVLTAFSLFKG